VRGLEAGEAVDPVGAGEAKGGGVTVEDPAVRRHIERWAQSAVTRTRADDPNRLPWNRARFMKELTEDAPELPFGAVVDITDRFERCVERANNSLDGAMRPRGRAWRLKGFLESEFHLK
jgi:hypothetical protein